MKNIVITSASNLSFIEFTGDSGEGFTRGIWYTITYLHPGSFDGAVVTNDCFRDVTLSHGDYLRFREINRHEVMAEFGSFHPSFRAAYTRYARALKKYRRHNRCVNRLTHRQRVSRRTMRAGEGRRLSRKVTKALHQLFK